MLTVNLHGAFLATELCSHEFCGFFFVGILDVPYAIFFELEKVFKIKMLNT